MRQTLSDDGLPQDPRFLGDTEVGQEKSLKSPSELFTLSPKGCSQEIKNYITETKDEV